MKNWWVIANAARARVLEEPDRSGGFVRFVHLADLVHPASRRKGIDLAHDRPGHVEGTGHGLGSAAYNPRTNPRDREHDLFAQELAAFLDAGVADGRCAGLVLVASSPFLGQLKGHLGRQATKLVLRTEAHDYSALPDDELAQRLGLHS